MRIQSSSDRKMAWKIIENINWETASFWIEGNKKH
jgi:hypothetical protein